MSRERNVRIAAGAGVILTFWAAIVCAAPAKIIDGSPRIFVNGRQWSWGIGMSSSMCSGVGISNWRFASADSYCNSIPVDDSLRLTKDSWTKNVDYTNVDTPVVMMVYATCVKPTGPSDTAAINLGARKLMVLADTLKAHGVDWVFYTTRHRREMRYRDLLNARDDWFDTCVIKEYSRRVGENLHADVMTTSIAMYPYTVQTDLEHPAGPLIQLYNTRWLQALYAHDGQVPPASLESSLASSYNKEVAKRAPIGITITAPASHDTVRIGSEMSVEVTVAASSVGTAKAHVHLIGCVGAVAGQFIVGIDSVLLTAAKTTFSFTIPDSAPVWMYSPSGAAARFPVLVDSAQVQVMLNPASYNSRTSNFQMTEMFRIADRSGVIPIAVGRVPAAAPRVSARGAHLAVMRAGGTLPAPWADARDLAGRRIGERQAPSRVIAVTK